MHYTHARWLPTYLCVLTDYRDMSVTYSAHYIQFNLVNFALTCYWLAAFI